MIGEQEREILLSALNTYGIDTQLDILVEECAELIKAVIKFRRWSGTKEDVYGNLMEEIADVIIMCEQMMVFFGPADIEEHLKAKIARLKERLDMIPGKGRYK